MRLLGPALCYLPRRQLQTSTPMSSEGCWALQGVELVYPMPVGTLEVGFVRVLKSRDHDGWRNGIHVGFAARPF